MKIEIEVCAVRSSTINVTARGVVLPEARETAPTSVDSEKTATVSMEEPRIVRTLWMPSRSTVNGSSSGRMRADTMAATTVVAKSGARATFGAGGRFQANRNHEVRSMIRASVLSSLYLAALAVMTLAYQLPV